MDWALFVTGCSQSSLEALAQAELGISRLEAQGTQGSVSALYRTDYTLTAQEFGA